MKKKINLASQFPVVSALLALGLATTAFGQSSTQVPVPSPMTTNASGAVNYGLIGQDYYSFDFGYTHHVDGPPSVLHRYGFAANKPFAPGYDVGLKYDWTTGSAFGVNARQQDVSIPLTAYLYNAWGRPFIEADAGWLWQKVGGGGGSTDSFAYLLGAGFELQVRPALVITPYVNFQEAPHVHARGWTYGAKATYRVTRQWGVSLGAMIDEEHDLEYTGGVNFHF